MPDTLDRLMDGAAAGILFAHTRHSFHPAQTMLNHFREPQSADLVVQAALDSVNPRAALFLDLAKAFECVNAHRILRILFIKQAPIWVLQFAQRVFFGRSIRHKVQGRLLPPRTVHSGVDMGRSSSVFFFCLAMDPIFVYLNQIPQCVLVAGYVDDITIVGEAHSDFEWITQILRACSSWASAGFRIDMHECWHIGYCLQHIENQNQLLSVEENPLTVQWATTTGSPCFAYLSLHITRPLPQVVIKRQTHYIVVNWRTFVIMHTKGHKLLHQLAALPCKCRSKLAVLTNHKLKCSKSLKLDNTTIGMQTLTDQTPSLGLQLSGYYKFVQTSACYPQSHTEKPDKTRRHHSQQTQYSQPHSLLQCLYAELLLLRRNSVSNSPQRLKPTVSAAIAGLSRKKLAPSPTSSCHTSLPTNRTSSGSRHNARRCGLWIFLSSRPYLRRGKLSS